MYLSRLHTTAATLGAIVLKPAGCVTSAPDQARACQKIFCISS
jgi:hypothetical protein